MKEWYLITPPVFTSGFESDDLVDYGTESFDDALNSAIAKDLELYNYDLSVRKDIKAIMIDTIQDTKLKSLKRQILVKPGTLTAGMYIKYEGVYWLIDNFVDDNSIYQKAIMLYCNHKLAWRNASGKIIERWINAASASQYNNGETGSTYYTFRSDQLMLSLPNDDECIMLGHSQRFVIDKRCKIYEQRLSTTDTMIDTHYPLITYRLTRNNGVVYDYGENGGIVEYLVSEDEQHDGDGYYVIAGKHYWLCDSPNLENSPVDIVDAPEPVIGESQIVTDSDVIYIGLNSQVFVSEFYDSEHNLVELEPNWNIDFEYKTKLLINQYENAIEISTNDISLNGKTFTLILSHDGYDDQRIDVKLKVLL